MRIQKVIHSVDRIPAVRALCWLTALCGLLMPAAAAGTVVSGEVRDLNGHPIPQARVTVSQPGTDGAMATTVFTDDAGHFSFTRPVADERRNEVTVEDKALASRMVFPAHKALKLPAAGD